MFIQVKVLTGSQRSLWYKTDDNQSYVGCIVQVPLKNSVVPAIVINTYQHAPKTSFDIKEITSIEPFPGDTSYATFIKQLAHYYQVEPLHFIKRIRQFLKQNEVSNTNSEYSSTQIAPKKICLTNEQESIFKQLKPFIKQSLFKPTVLQGITGSGKTEVYKKLIQESSKEHKSVLFLLPEVTLALGFEHRLREELPEIKIVSFHSATTMKQKQFLWQLLLSEQPIVIVGVHLPVLLPIANLGLIIVDEEHDTGFQEKKHPKINSKEAALIKAQANNIPIILGSATPSFQTLHNIEAKKWQHFMLTKRFAGSLPTIKTVLLTDKKQRKNFWISKPLEQAIKDRLQKKEQTIIFLNRRGYSFFVQCKQCSFTFSCTNCSVSLTLHGESVITCHYCNLSKSLPSKCPECSADAAQFLKKGIGTQQVVSILQNLFPQATIARADLDTTTRKKQWQQTMLSFSAGDIDILVGTQTITKGYDFPKVTLVGVLWADLQLHFPIYNASEITLQQLIQVAGRAGRRDNTQSLVIIQTLDNHAIFNYVDETRYKLFFEKELLSRKMVGYPPAKRLAEIELKHKQEQIVQKEAELIATLLLKNNNEDLIILGPAKPPVHKIKNIFTRKIYLKSQNIQTILKAYQSIRLQRIKSNLFFTPNPVT